MHKANSRSVLFLTELIIAILIFALSMGICGGVFANAFMTAQSATNLNEAVFLSESAAEAFRAYDDIADFALGVGGDSVGDEVHVYYDRNWQPLPDPDGAQYSMVVSVSEDDGLSTAVITVSRGSKPFFDLTAIKNNALGRAAS
jgi:hypothetical protein